MSAMRAEDRLDARGADPPCDGSAGMRHRAVARALCVAGIAAMAWGCNEPLIPFSLDAPPVIL